MHLVPFSLLTVPVVVAVIVVTDSIVTHCFFVCLLDVRLFFILFEYVIYALNFEQKTGW